MNKLQIVKEKIGGFKMDNEERISREQIESLFNKQLIHDFEYIQLISMDNMLNILEGIEEEIKTTNNNLFDIQKKVEDIYKDLKNIT